jgi:hypothetical protein
MKLLEELAVIRHTHQRIQQQLDEIDQSDRMPTASTPIETIEHLQPAFRCSDIDSSSNESTVEFEQRSTSNPSEVTIDECELLENALRRRQPFCTWDGATVIGWLEVNTTTSNINRY